MLRNSIQWCIRWCLWNYKECQLMVVKCPKGFKKCYFCLAFCDLIKKCPFKNIIECDLWK
jgi:hypothetical protein